MKQSIIKWLLGALVVISFAGVAGYFNKADAQEITITNDDGTVSYCSVDKRGNMFCWK